MEYTKVSGYGGIRYTKYTDTTPHLSMLEGAYVSLERALLGLVTQEQFVVSYKLFKEL
jgi:hypothetical protein